MLSRQTLVPNDRPLVRGASQNEGIIGAQAVPPVVLGISALGDKMGQAFLPELTNKGQREKAEREIANDEATCGAKFSPRVDFCPQLRCEFTIHAGERKLRALRKVGSAAGCSSVGVRTADLVRSGAGKFSIAQTTFAPLE